MSLTVLLVLVVVLGVFWVLAITQLPIPDTGRKIVNILFTMLFALFALVIFVTLLSALGLSDIRIGLPKAGG